MTTMTEDQIKMHAEVRANLHHNPPMEIHFQQAEDEIRAMLAEGATYDERRGCWEWPA